MPAPHFSALSGELRPLLNKFYRAHHSPMRATADDLLWVAKAGDIVGALCLRPLPRSAGFWLTGLFVAPAQRQGQIASQLVVHACEQAAGPVWLFCHPQLSGFYARLGFTPANDLPPVLAERLQRYQRSKPLIALKRIEAEASPTGGGIEVAEACASSF